MICSTASSRQFEAKTIYQLPDGKYDIYLRKNIESAERTEGEDTYTEWTANEAYARLDTLPDGIDDDPVSDDVWATIVAWEPVMETPEEEDTGRLDAIESAIVELAELVSEVIGNG